MKIDDNRNVKSLFNDIELNQSEIGFESYNHLFTNNMNIMIDEFGIYKNLPLNSRSKYKQLNVEKDEFKNEESSINNVEVINSENSQ